MICKALKERNYLEPYDFYMRLTVGVALLLSASNEVRAFRPDCKTSTVNADMCCVPADFITVDCHLQVDQPAPS